MLKNIVESKVNSALNAMHNSNFEFTLTGSRYILHKPITKDTDYDFFTVETLQVEVFLASIGFTLDHRAHTTYSDIVTSRLYRLYERNPTSQRLISLIDVQLIPASKIAVKTRINDLFKKYPHLLNESKSYNKMMWHIFLELALENAAFPIDVSIENSPNDIKDSRIIEKHNENNPLH